MIAALYVAPRGCYVGLTGVDAWPEARDARLYEGPWPVVAHPPCARWGSYYAGGPSAKVRRVRGDDGGCFAAALASVRRWGGVLEHPRDSSAWRAHGLNAPPRAGGWIAADWVGGWTCCVEQGHYGHRARKATWLYACGVGELPDLVWGPSARTAVDDRGPGAGVPREWARPPRGMDQATRAARRAWIVERERVTGKAWCCPERLTKRERTATPLPFRDLLLSIARTAARTEVE